MKKVLIVLLILAVAGGAFAQEITWSGLATTGFEGSSVKVGDADAVTGFKQEVHEKDENRTDINTYRAQIAMKAEISDTMSFYGMFRTQTATPGGASTGGSGNVGNIFYAPYIYGKATAFDVVDVYGGIISNSAWATSADAAEDVGEGTGALIQLRPIEGLNVGFGMYGNGQSDFLEQLFGYGIAYTMEDTFKIVASGRTNNQTIDRAAFGLSIMAIENLTLALEGYSWSTNVKDNYWTIDLVAKYAVSEALNVGATLWYHMNKTDWGNLAGTGVSDAANNKDAMAFVGRLWANYGLFENAVVPELRVDVGYNSVKDLVNVLVIKAKPMVALNIGENAQIVAAYEFGYGMADGDGINLAHGKDSVTGMSHTGYVDFIYSF